jgi:RNA polymerase sigma-70 factor (ECF subfamily)
MQLLMMKEKESIIQSYYQAIYKYALLKLKSVEQALDVTQEVFYRYLKYDKVFESEEHEKNWLYRTAANLCNSYWRSGWYKHILFSNEDTEFVTEVTPLNDCIDKENAEIVFSTVLDLPIKYRELIHLFYYENMSIREIAIIVGRKESTIQTQLARGRSILRRKLEEAGYERF